MFTRRSIRDCPMGLFQNLRCPLRNFLKDRFAFIRILSGIAQPEPQVYIQPPFCLVQFAPPASSKNRKGRGVDLHRPCFRNRDLWTAFTSSSTAFPRLHEGSCISSLWSYFNSQPPFTLTDYRNYLCPYWLIFWGFFGVHLYYCTERIWFQDSPQN